MKKYLKKLKHIDKDLVDLVRGGGINFIFYGLNLAIVYFLAIIITKYYGSAAYGRYSIIKSLILVLIILNTLGLNTYAIKLAAHKNHFENGFFKSDFLKKSYFILIFTSIIFTIVLFFFKREIAIVIFKDENLEVYLIYFPVILLFSVFLNYNSNVLKGQGKILSFSVISSFLNNFIFIILLILIFNWYSKSELFLVISLLISFLIAFIVSAFNIFPLRFSKERITFKYSDLIKESFPMMLSSSMIFIIFSVDILMLGYFDTSENVGIYRIVTQISGLNAVFLIIFSAIVGPKIANLFSDGRNLEIEPLIKKSSKIILFITFPILILILVFSKEILLFFGTDYLAATKAIIILSICQFIYAISGFVDLILNMTGNQKIFGRITVLTAVLNIVLNLFLIPKYGITGAAISTGFSILLTNALGIIYIHKKYKFLPFYIPFTKIK
jgi:O-antigen/teichoic acid export membrane protein